MKNWNRVRPEIKIHPKIQEFNHLSGHLYMDNTDNYLLKYCQKEFGIKSFIDIGCGLGRQVELGLDLGIKSIGIDGDFTLKYEDMKNWVSPVNILIHDFTTGKPEIKENFDLGSSVEFLEHIEEKYLDNVFSVYNKCKYVFVASAGEGQPGHHHVNCQNDSYWIDKFKEYNFNLSSLHTDRLRLHSTLNATKERGLFFINMEFDT
jgi:hypothetical protein